MQDSTVQLRFMLKKQAACQFASAWTDKVIARGICGTVTLHIIMSHMTHLCFGYEVRDEIMLK